MPLSDATKATRRLQKAVDKMDSCEVAADEARRQWEAEVLDAYDAGLTYHNIAEISGKSRVRIDQVIRAERVRRNIPVNTR